MSTHVNLSDDTFHVGETLTIDVTCLDADGVPIDLTGASIVFRLASRSARLLDAVVGAGVTITDAAAGECRVIITPSMQSIAGIPPGDHLYELRVTSSGGAVSIQAEGVFTLSDSLFRKYA
jgi:hypothetical protein